MSKKIISVLLCIVLTVSVFTAFGINIYAADETVTVNLTGKYNQTDSRAMLSLINNFRQSSEAWYWNSSDTEKVYENSLGALKYDYELEKVAMQRAAEIAVCWSHTRPSGQNTWTAYPSGYNAKGENIAAGYNTMSTPEQAFISLREDNCNFIGQGHRRTMLDSNFTAVGFACFIYQGTYYWVQEFSSPVSSTPETPANDSTTVVPVEIAVSNITSAEMTLNKTFISVEDGSSEALPEATISLGIDGQWPKGAITFTIQPIYLSNDNSIAMVSGTSVLGVNGEQTTLIASFPIGLFNPIAELTVTIIHDWGVPTYEWSTDNLTCTAIHTCSRFPSHTKSETVFSVSKIISGTDCNKEAIIRYTATFESPDFEEQIKNVQIPILGHDWGETTYEWSSDNKTCTATRVCSRDASHIETETVDSTMVEIEADYGKPGKIIFTANFENEAFETQTTSVETPAYKGFPDVSKDAWYFDAVKYCAKHKFINGYGNGSFGPSNALQRQDFVVILANIAGASLSGYTACKLTDVDMNAYYGKAVAWAVDKGIIAGYQNGKFGVGDPINREQVATILYRYMKNPAVSDVDSKLAKFPDKGNISEFAKAPLAWAVENNIISGMQDGTVAPKGTAVRAQIASIIMRMDQNGMFNA